MLLSALLVVSVAASDDRTWPAPVPGHVPPAAGEHPRLFFRKADVAELRRRAATPEGQKIVARLKATLGGGEAMPKHQNPIKVAYDGNASLPEGAYSIGHAAGFGMLYQLTGDAKYAELGKQCFEWGWDNVRDIDPPARYSLVYPAGQLRLGPSLAWYALGYDLCHDGWDPAFREKVAKFLNGYNQPNSPKPGTKPDPKAKGDWDSLRELAEKPRHEPSSNHWGSIVGGAGLTLLAIRGDAGTDTAQVDSWLKAVEHNAKRAVTEGFGDHGMFSEGQGAGHTGCYPALISYFQAMRVAGGKDFLAGRPNVPWLTLRWIMEVTNDDEGRAWYPIRGGGAYGSPLLFGMGGALSHGGWFSQGFGAIPDDYKPALLWTYRTFCAQDDAGRYDSENYPQRAVLALINWPIGVEPKNPSTLMPKAVHDDLHGYYMFRDQWQDRSDSIVTIFQNRGPQPYAPNTDIGVRILRDGRKVNVNPPKMSGTAQVRTEADGSGVVQWSASAAVAVDFSDAAGVPVVVAVLGGSASKEPQRFGFDLEQTVKLGGANLVICTITPTAQHPKAVVAGDVVTLGGLTLRVADGKLTVSRGTPGLGANPVDGWKAKGIAPEVPLAESEIVLPEPSFSGFTFDPDTVYQKDGVQYVREIRGSGQDSAVYGAAFEKGLTGMAITFPQPDAATGNHGGRTAPGPAFDPAGGSFSMSWWVKLKEPLQGYGLFFEKSNFKGVHADLFHTGWHPGPLLNFDKNEIPFPNEADTWYHLAVVTDKDKKLFTYYLDGKAEAVNPIKKISNGKTSFYFGRGSGPDTVKMGFKSGLLDDVLFWKKALTRGEVMALFRAGRTP